MWVNFQAICWITTYTSRKTSFLNFKRTYNFSSKVYFLLRSRLVSDHHRHGPTTVKYFGQSQLASITFDAVERRTDPPFHHATSPILAHDLPEKDLRGRSQKVIELSDLFLYRFSHNYKNNFTTNKFFSNPM